MINNYFMDMIAVSISHRAVFFDIFYIIGLFIIISIIEGIFNLVYLHFKKVSTSFFTILSVTFEINLLTTLLGGLLSFFFPKVVLMVFTIFLCLILSIILEQLMLSWIIDNNIINLSDNEKLVWFNAVALSNFISYLVLTILFFTENGSLSTEIYYLEYENVYILGISLFIVGIWYLLRVSNIKNKVSPSIKMNIRVLILLNFLYYVSFNFDIPFSSFVPLFVISFIIILYIVISLSTILISELMVNSYREYFLINSLVSKGLGFLKITTTKTKELYQKRSYSVTFVLLVLFLVSSIFLSLPTINYTLPHHSLHDTLIVNLNHEFRTWDIRQLDPHDPSYEDHHLVMQQVYGYLGLLAPGNGSIVLPGIAETWKVNTDGSITFILRGNAYFHNGDTIRARDVEYSWKMGLLTVGKLTSIDDLNWSNYWQFIYPEDDPTGQGRVFTVKDQTGNLNTEELLLEVSGTNPVYALQPEGYDMRNSTVLPISCGPFSCYDYISNDFVLLERFDEWYGWGQSITSVSNDFQLNYTFPDLFDSWKYIEFRVIPETSIQIEELLNGRIIGLIMNDYTIDRELVMTVNNSDGFLVNEFPIDHGIYFGFNIQGEQPEMFNGSGNYPLTESWFRRVISLAINSTALQEISSFNTSNLESFSSFLPITIQETITGESTISQIYFNRSKAIELLEDHGYYPLNFTEEGNNRFGFGTYLNETRGKNKGKHFLLGVLSDDEKRLGEQIQNDLQEIGIFIDLLEFHYYSWRLQTPGSNFNDPDFSDPMVDFCLTKRNYYLPIASAYLADFSFDYWWTKGEWCYNGGWNDSYYEQSIKNLDSLDWTEKPDEYMTLILDLNNHLAQEMPQVPLLWKSTVVLFNSHLHNFLLNPSGDLCMAYSYWN